MASVHLEKATIVNDAYRDAAFNRRYYSCRLHQVQRMNLLMDIVVAVGTSGAVAVWNVWHEGYGSLLWKGLAAVATLFAIAKPFLNLSKQIERYTELVTGWAGVFYDLRHLTVQMRTTGEVGPTTWLAFDSTQQKVKELGIKDDPGVNRRLQRRCFEEVKVQIPSESLWWPEDSNDKPRQEPHAAVATGP